MKEIFKKTRDYAIYKHGNQTYGDVPYVKHLDDVIYILIEHGFDKDKYILSGYLHDIIEDTDTSYNDINKAFGKEIAEIIYCLTDELGKNRKERKEKTYSKLRTNTDSVIIKLADRIANIQNGIKNGSSILKTYVDEHGDFICNIITKENFEPAFVLYKTLNKLIESINNK